MYRVVHTDLTGVYKALFYDYHAALDYYYSHLSQSTTAMIVDVRTGSSEVICKEKIDV